MKTSSWEKFKNWCAGFWANPKKRRTFIGVLVVLLVGLFAVPYTRYNILGVVLKASVTVQAVDSKTGAPVSGATIELSGQKAETQANGEATLRVNLGTGSLKVSKKYYTAYQQNKLVGTGKNVFKTSLVATGHQIKVKLTNKVTGKPLSGAKISASGANTKTDAKGMATIVIPSGATTQPATVTADGYNTLNVSLVASDDLSKDTFAVTPSGKIYFLSNLSGTIDVVKTNLDGTERQTVLAGTGSEDRNTTSLLASRDWKYLALLSKRSGENPSLYLIDTTNGDKLSTIDEGNANFTLVGWSDDRFVYKVDRSGMSNWQPNQTALKSFDPTNGHTLLLDQTQASGTNDNDYVKQTLGSIYLMEDQVVYTKGWISNYSTLPPAMIGKTAELDSIGADGSGHKTLKTFSRDATTYYIDVTTRLYEPSALYLAFDNAFYQYEDGKVTATTAVSSNDFYDQIYPTFLLSPSGNNTFWAEQRDGKNTLSVGDKDAKSPKQIATLSPYNPYGWFSDDYLLVSKNSSEVYIMSKDGGTPLKITDYYKPAINYNGYGGGYGGL